MSSIQPPTEVSRPRPRLADLLRRFADVLSVLGLPLMAGWLAAASGRDLNWDQLNYHVYIAHAFLQDRLAVDFNAASIQSYINPLPQLPFYWLATGSFSSWSATFLLGALHGTAFSFLYLAARLATRPWRGYSVAAALAVVAIALSHPVVTAELGSSLAEIVACIPMMAALTALYAARHARSDAARNGWIAFGFAAAGAAVALKLVFVVFAAGLFALLLVLGATWRDRFVLASTAAISLLLGWYVAGGFWHLDLQRVFGNPFFPFFNDVFRSPDFPAVPLANDRFSRRTAADILAFPWHMLEIRKFVTTERVVVDPRYALLVVGVFATLVVAWRRRELRLDWAAAAAAGLVFVWFVGWAFSSGNGRYALPMHMATGLGFAYLATRLWHDRFRGTMAVVATALLCVWVNQEFAGMAHWTRRPHSDRWYEVEVPEQAKVANALYVSAGFYDRSSQSFLVPWLPASARFANLAGYSNPAPADPDGRRLLRMIAGHQGPIRLLTEGTPEGWQNHPSAKALWIKGLQATLAGYGLELRDEASCRSVRVNFSSPRPSDRWRPHLSVCDLVRVPAHDARMAFATVDSAFDDLEKSFPGKLYPPHAPSYFRASGYCRFYPPQEYYMCNEGGVIEIFRIDPREVLLRRKVEAVQNLPPS